MALKKITKSSLKSAFDVCNHLIKQEDEQCIIKTGFKNIDTNRGGLRRGEIYVLAGRPAMGKTAFVLNLVKHVAVDEKRPIVYFFGSHNSFTIQANLLKLISATEQKTDSLNFEEYEAPVSKIVNAPVYYYEGNDFSEADVLANILEKRISPDLIVFDEVNNNLLSGREYQRIARAMNCPVIITVSVSRDVEERDDHVPLLCDIKDQALAKQADNVWILYRDAYYDYESIFGNRADLHISKSSYPNTGIELFEWHSESMKFIEYEEAGICRGKEKKLIEKGEPLIEEAIKYACSQEKVSIGMLQQKFSIGFNRAARMLDLLIEKDIISEVKGSYITNSKQN